MAGCMCWIKSRPKAFSVDGDSNLTGEQMVVSALNVRQEKDATLTLKDSLISGDACTLRVFGPGWYADRNSYAVSEILYNGRSFCRSPLQSTAGNPDMTAHLYGGRRLLGRPAGEAGILYYLHMLRQRRLRLCDRSIASGVCTWL